MRARLLVSVLVVGPLLFLVVAAAVREPPVAVAIEHGAILPYRGTARLRVTVVPNRKNAGLWTAIESSGYASAHYEQLDGAHAPRVRWVEFKDLPSGDYTAWVRLLWAHGETSARVTFIVGHSKEPFP